MNDKLYVTRLLSHLSGVKIHTISYKTYTPEEYARIKQWKDWLKEQPFVHIYDPSMSMEKFFSVCRSLQNSMNLSFIVYDYLKSNKTSTGENYNALGDMTNYLKNEIAGRLNLPVLAACQLNSGLHGAQQLQGYEKLPYHQRKGQRKSFQQAGNHDYQWHRLSAFSGQ